MTKTCNNYETFVAPRACFLQKSTRQWKNPKTKNPDNILIRNKVLISECNLPRDELHKAQT